MKDNLVKIGIYLSDIDSANNGPIFEDGYPYTKAHPQLYELLTKYGAKVILVHDKPRTYKGNGVFSEWWEPKFENNKLTGYQLHEQDIKIKFLYDKSRFGSEEPGIYVLNPIEIVKICSNKMESYNLIPELHPRTELVESNDKLAEILKNLPKDQNIVIKKLDSSGGKDVYIGKPADYQNNLELPVIIQEYIETISGIPGLTSGRHDLRVGLYNNQPISAMIRRPPEGELRANITFGGRAEFISPDRLPKDALEIAKQVDNKFAKYPDRFISVDFVYSGKEWKVMEINSWPGLNDAEISQEAFNYMDNLAKGLVKSASKYQ